MGLKYFEYISKSKVDMLEVQLRRRSFIRRIVGKVSAFGVTAELSADNNADESLVQRSLILMRAMDKRSLRHPMNEEAEFNTSTFYEDRAEWSHGLFTFSGRSGGGNASIISYLVWRRWNDAIILLAGSPLNVLGEHQISGDAQAPGTSGTWEAVMRFAQRSFPWSADESLYITSTSPEEQRRYHERYWLTIFNSGGYCCRFAVAGGHEVSRWRRPGRGGTGPPGAGAAGRRGDDRGRGRRPGGAGLQGGGRRAVQAHSRPAGRAGGGAGCGPGGGRLCGSVLDAGPDRGPGVAAVRGGVHAGRDGCAAAPARLERAGPGPPGRRAGRGQDRRLAGGDLAGGKRTAA